jgi:predicted nuclease with TOPRIM domain
MKQALDKFCKLFHVIQLEVVEKEIKNKLSVESIFTGEMEIKKMLSEAKKAFSKYKKLHKNGKASSDEVFEYEWRVHELQDHLSRFKDDNINIDGNDIT